MIKLLFILSCTRLGKKIPAGASNPETIPPHQKLRQLRSAGSPPHLVRLRIAFNAWTSRGVRSLRAAPSPKLPRVFSRVSTDISRMVTSRRSSQPPSTRCTDTHLNVLR